ncbi:hypothetical protein [Roseateles sp. MS654]|uniref:hypothetical protein n=1 Tax=Roseateles sp. MS654 TaxID=3412685 RepID=UPI003C2AE3C2
MKVLRKALPYSLTALAVCAALLPVAFSYVYPVGLSLALASVAAVLTYRQLPFVGKLGKLGAMALGVIQLGLFWDGTTRLASLLLS